jgi:hypothetical protein
VDDEFLQAQVLHGGRQPVNPAAELAKLAVHVDHSPFRRDALVESLPEGIAFGVPEVKVAGVDAHLLPVRAHSEDLFPTDVQPGQPAPIWQGPRWDRTEFLSVPREIIENVPERSGR